MRSAAALTLGTSVILTIGLSLSLAAVVFRLYSQVPQGIPPVLPGLILSLAMAAGSFLFLGLRLRQGRKVRPATYQMALSLVAVGVVVLVRQAARLFGAEWTASGSVLLGMSGLVLCTSGTLVRRPARGALVEEEVPAGVAEGRHAEVETLVGEIQEEYRRVPVPPPPLNTWQLVREGFLRPARAFRELKVRPHLELCGVIPLAVLLWPRLTSFAHPGETVGVRILGGVDYALWILLYDLGKATMFWGIARIRGRPASYASALAGFMIIDFPSLTTYIMWHLWPGQYTVAGSILYNQLGLGPFFAHLATTQPGLFDIIAKVDLLHVWTFLLWWVAVAVLLEMKVWVALLVTAVTFPAAHILAAFAEIFLYVVTWGEPSPFFDV